MNAIKKTLAYLDAKIEQAEKDNAEGRLDGFILRLKGERRGIKMALRALGLCAFFDRGEFKISLEEPWEGLGD